MRVDPGRLVRATTLAVWTAVFAWLWIDGSASIYVGPRTSWIVPFGTAALATCTAVVLLGATGLRERGPRPSLRELAGLAVLLAPVVAVLVVDSPQLGANAADRRAGTEVSVDDLPATEGGALDLISFAAASQDPKIAEELGADKSGRRVAFAGIVTRREDPRLEITRFKIYCCAADAIPYTARLDDPNGLAAEVELNDWVYVRGKVHRAADGALTVLPDSLEPVAAPLDPYL